VFVYFDCCVLILDLQETCEEIRCVVFWVAAAQYITDVLEQSAISDFCSEEEISVFLRNVDNHPWNNDVLRFTMLPY
jgi:hypothetical protein